MQLGDVLELQLLDDVGHPAFAEGFPGDRRHRARTKQRPQRHLDRTGVGCRHDADLVVGGDFQHVARQLDGELELGLADLRAMRAAKGGIPEIFGGPAGALGTGAGGKMRHDRPLSGLRCSHQSILPDSKPPVGGRCPDAVVRRNIAQRQGTSRSVRACSRGCGRLARALFRCGAEWRMSGRRAVQERHRCIGADPGADRGEADIDPVLGVADDSE